MAEISIGGLCNTMSIGQVCHVKLIAVEDFESIDEPLNDVVISFDKILLKPTYTVYTADFYQKEAKLLMKEVDTNAGTEHTFVLSWMVKHSVALQQWLNTNRNTRWVVIAKTTAGDIYFHGCKDSFWKLNWDTSVDGNKMTKILMNTKSWHPMLYIVDTDLQMIFANTDFSTEFSIDFNA